MAKRTLAKVSTTELNAEIARRGRQIKTLQRRRARVASELASIDAEIQARGGAAGATRAAAAAGPRRRPRNEMNLEESLVKLLRNKTLGVSEITEKVQAAGYKTSSVNFRTIVNQALITGSAFKRVSRGKYTVKANYK